AGSSVPQKRKKKKMIFIREFEQAQLSSLVFSLWAQFGFLLLEKEKRIGNPLLLFPFPESRLIL
ncbi:MAG: hypothetical protein ABIA67_05315, partial [Candidatus Margulisiibacteriota bacterium]